jgi:acetyl-CoA synthetase
VGLQANYLRSLGVKKGDAVSIYMPMVCELPIAMLACARIGAVHSVVFGGFSAEALAGEQQLLALPAAAVVCNVEARELRWWGGSSQPGRAWSALQQQRHGVK